MTKPKNPDMSYVGDANSVPHGAAFSVKDPYAIEGQAGLWKGDVLTDEARARLIDLAITTKRERDADALDGRALLDGRLPADWKQGDAIPDCAKANHPESHYLADFASHRLCTCGLPYFMLGAMCFFEPIALQKAS